MIGALRRVALDDLQLVAVMIAGAIEPRLIVEAGDGDDERVAFPHADRLPHPRIDRRRAGILQQDVAHRAGVFIRDEDRLVAVQDLERHRHVVRARHAGQVALDLRIAIEPVRLVLFLLLRGLRQIRNLVAFDDAVAGGHGADGAEREHRRGGHRHDRTRPKCQRRLRLVRQDVVVRGVERLPDAVQVWLAGDARGTRRLGLDGCCHPEAGGDDGGGREGDGNISEDSVCAHCAEC